MMRAGTLVALALLPMFAAHDAARLASHGADMLPVPIHGRTLHVSRYEVTVAQWNDCAAAGYCPDIARKSSLADKTPMTGVSWFDAQNYIQWANATSGRRLRLPTRDEWRAFSRLPEPKPRQRLFEDPRMEWAAHYGQEETPGGPVRPQGAWSATSDGIADVAGNVWEWTSSCSAGGLGEVDMAHCPAMKVMGAHEASVSVLVRKPSAGGCAAGTPPTHLGFRLVED